jgi:hypothetical protein
MLKLLVLRPRVVLISIVIMENVIQKVHLAAIAMLIVGANQASVLQTNVLNVRLIPTADLAKFALKIIVLQQFHSRAIARRILGANLDLFVPVTTV